MTTLRIAEADPATAPVDAVVIGVHPSPVPGGSPTLALGADNVALAFNGELPEALRLLGASGAVGEVTILATFGVITPRILVTVGLGEVPDVDTQGLRQAARVGVATLAGHASVALALPVVGSAAGVRAAAVRAISEGALLGVYQFPGYAGQEARSRRAPVESVTVIVPDAGELTAREEIRRATALAAAVGRARDWVNTPPNELTPPMFADEVAEAAKGAGLDVEVMDEAALRERGYGGILAVGKGSCAGTRLVRLAYRPTEPANRHIALVGKGITFDSGGLSLKQARAMLEMKSDMAGAAAVAGAMLAVAQLRPRTAVTAYLPMAENMPSGSAYRPGDVVRMYDGTTVEILNTDAEGRIVVADAIARAIQDRPDCLFEVSTLAGGALGRVIAAVMGDTATCEVVREQGASVGEPVWSMPMPEDVRRALRSEIADIAQVAAGLDPVAQMLQAGLFLSRFIPDGLPWAHIEVSGIAYRSGQLYGDVPAGATGVPLRTLVALIEHFSEEAS